MNRLLFFCLLLITGSLSAQRIQYNRNTKELVYTDFTRPASTTYVLPTSAVLMATESYSTLNAATSPFVVHDGYTWVRKVGLPRTSVGQGYVTTTPQNGWFYERLVPGNIFSPALFGAIGNNVTNDLTALNRGLAYIEAIGGGTLKVPESTTYAYGGSAGYLIAGSNTTIDGRNGAFRQLSGTNTNMIRTRANVTGVGRTVNLTIRGGVWDRGNNGGVANDNHALFLRAVDNLLIEQASFITAPNISKYAIALGNVNKYTVRDCHAASIGSDFVHITGPAKQGWIGRLSGFAGDDFVAVTTRDYDALDDTRGTVDGLYVGYIRGNNGTRIVLLGCSSDTIRNVVVDHVQQLGTGAVVSIGDGAFRTGRVDDVAISNVVGNTLVRHWNIGQLSIRRARAKNPIVTFAREGRDAGSGGTGTEYGSSGVENAWISECTSLSNSTLESVFLSDTSVNIGQLHIDKLATTTGAFSINGKVKSVVLSNSNIATTSNLANLAGTVGDVVFDKVNAYSGATGNRIISTIASTTIGAITFQSCSFSAVNSTTGDLVYNQAGARIGTINVANTRVSFNNRILQQPTGLPLMVLNLSNLTANANNRLLETGSPVTVNYSNVTLTNQVNTPFRTFNAAATLTVRGSGWSGYTSSAIVRSSTETINVIAPDMFVEPSQVATTLGNSFYAVNNAVGVPVGPILADGGTFSAPLYGPRKLAVVTNIDGKTTGTTTLYTVPANRQLIVTSVHIRTTNSNAITVPATVEVNTLTAGDIFPSQSLSGLTIQEGVYSLTTSTAKRAVGAGATVKLNVTTPATGTSQIWAVELVGYLN